MKLKNYFSIISLFIISSSVFGQANAKMKDDKTYSKFLQLENPTTINDAIALFSKQYNLGKDYSYIAQPSNEDLAGNFHQRNQQYYKGIKIEFGMLITHSKNGLVTAVNGELYNAEGLNLVPSLSKIQGFELAKASTSGTRFLWENKDDAAAMNYQKPEGEMVIFSMVRTGEVKLAYKYDIYAIEPLLREEIFVDANTGAILYKNPIIKHAHDLNLIQKNTSKNTDSQTLAAGTAATRYSGSRPIETTLNSGFYVLNDFSRGTGILTYNSARTVSYPTTNFTDADNNWTSIEFANTNKDNAALDAHWGAEMTYDFWKNIFNRNSYDNNNAQIKSFVHYRSVATQSLSNAFWNGSVMSYGDGTTNPFTPIDVCGHEIGHAICTHTASLAYQNQSGGMNEGYSDIWGACIEHYGRTGAITGTPVANVWLVGENISSGGLRSMGNPNSKSNPSCFKGTYWVTTADEGSCTPSSGNDYCGVHSNSGVLNKWFYILTLGESGTNNAPIAERDTYSVTGIGMLKAAQIAYFAERDYLTSNATYFDARDATLAVAGNLYCASSPEYIATTNAWFAVNIGDQYVAAANDVSLKSVSKDIGVNCGKVIAANAIFENAGSNPITSVSVSYDIDGGTATNTSWTGNLAVCSNQTFPLNIGTLSNGTHTLNVTTTITADGNSSNNTKSSFITMNYPGTVGNINTFENTTDDLISIDATGNTNDMWERGNIISKTNLTPTVAPTKVYATKLSGNYPDKTKSYLVSKCYNLTNATNPKVEFDMAYDLEPNFDVIYMQYSTNDGTTWANLGTGISTGWYNHAGVPNGTDCQECVGGQWNGTNSTMTHYSYSLPNSSMILRFVMVSDDAINNDGVVIDNFVITGTLATNNNTFEEFSIYPNPTNGSINLNLSTLADVKINLFDISGRNIYNNLFESNNLTFHQDINFGTLSKGIYLLNVESDGKKASKKLIVE